MSKLQDDFEVIHVIKSEKGIKEGRMRQKELLYKSVKFVKVIKLDRQQEYRRMLCCLKQEPKDETRGF